MGSSMNDGKAARILSEPGLRKWHTDIEPVVVPMITSLRAEAEEFDDAEMKLWLDNYEEYATARHGKRAELTAFTVVHDAGVRPSADKSIRMGGPDVQAPPSVVVMQNGHPSSSAMPRGEEPRKRGVLKRITGGGRGLP